MADSAGPGLSNQRRRTRKDLLDAAARLMKRGLRPTLEEVAEEALVSRATAYRYFPNAEALLIEAALDVEVPDAGDLFGAGTPSDPVLRLERLETAMDAMVRANERPLRMMLIQALERSLRDEGEGAPPARQNRRSALIEAALEPARRRLPGPSVDRLAKALALIIGTEARLVFKDVLQVADGEAADIKRWAIRALVEQTQRGG